MSTLPTHSKNRLNLACWNIHTILTEMLQRRSALIAQKLAKLNDALSKICFPDKGNLKEYYRLHFVLICQTQIGQMPFSALDSWWVTVTSLPIGSSDRITFMNLPFPDKQQHIMLISMYELALQVNLKDKDRFSTELNKILQNISKTVKVVIFGDLILELIKFLKYRKDCWEGMVQRNTMTTGDYFRNSVQNKYSASQTLSSNRKLAKTTWMHPHSKHQHNWLHSSMKDVYHTRLILSAECYIDYLILWELYF